MIKVGRCKYQGSRRIDPKIDGYKSILVMMKSHSKWGVLGPYELKDSSGCIMENIWQSSKVYEYLPAAIERYSRYDPTIIWEYPEETHVKDGKLVTEKYKKWREKLENNLYPVRYPVGFRHRHKCLYSLKNIGGGPLDYIEARKHIYLPCYTELVKKQPKFRELKELLATGQNLLIIEVDGPHEESLPYYKEKYGVDDEFIVDDSVDATAENLKILLNDPKHPFGHGYCLAVALLDLDVF